MSEREQLLLDLKRIRDNNYEIEEREDIKQYIVLMLKYIGDTNPELRDDLIFTTFCEWIYTREYFHKEELKLIMKELLDEKHLFYCIEDVEKDTVFTRTFSMLVIALILDQHRKKEIFNHNEFIDIKSSLVKYYGQEKDLRGYLGDKGWAHGAAHGADTIDELIQCKESDMSVCKEVLGAIKKVLYNENYIFFNEEDERIARVIYRMIKNNYMTYTSIKDWLNELCNCCEWERTRHQYIARVNSKNFIRSLYFKFKHKNGYQGIIADLLSVEAKLNRYVEIDKDI